VIHEETEMISRCQQGDQEAFLTIRKRKSPKALTRKEGTIDERFLFVGIKTLREIF
jgi:hypothetical protein